jgi:hypothetical protein
LKTIVILSTEPWGKMLLSKMHYAIVLAEMGNKVYFVNPPVDPPAKEPATSSAKALPIPSAKALATVIGNEVSGNLVIIDTRTIKGSLFFRHKLFFIYRRLSKRYASAIKKIVAAPIDELWCFNPHIYVDLRNFGAKKTILLIYDFYKGKHVFRSAETADGIITISRLILDHYQYTRPPKLLLQHGLGKHFADLAAARLKDQDFRIAGNGKIRIGYMGNLLRAGMNTEIATKIIRDNQDKEFHFWGPGSLHDNNVNGAGGDIPPGLLEFIEWLKQQGNVFLRGVRDQGSLSRELAEMDAFLFLYSPRKEMNAASNSHKLLEYLSTGKAIISTHVSNYADTDLLVMCGQEEEEKLPELFNKVINDLPLYNDMEKQKNRIAFALDNTYARQVERIQHFISR